MKNRYLAAFLAFILWWVWLHKFYLWKFWQGIVYILFCWTGIPMIIAFVECIYYIAISDKEFDIRYNADYIRNKRDLS